MVYAVELEMYPVAQLVNINHDRFHVLLFYENELIICDPQAIISSQAIYYFVTFACLHMI